MIFLDMLSELLTSGKNYGSCIAAAYRPWRSLAYPAT